MNYFEGKTEREKLEIMKMKKKTMNDKTRFDFRCWCIEEEGYIPIWDIRNHIKQDCDILEQYTSYKDIDNDDICEGDLLSQGDETCEVMFGIYNQAYHESIYGFYLRDINTGIIYNCNEFIIEGSKIIGNIHQHKEN